MRSGKLEIKKKKRRIIKQLILILSLFLISYFLFPAFIYASDSKEVIKAIEIEGLTRIKEEELIDLICFHVGDILNRRELSKGIRRAFKKGIFLDIQAISEQYDGGIKLKYIVKEIPLIKRITVEGNKFFSKRKIKKVFAFKEGENLKKEFIVKAESKLLSFYHRKGFPDVRVKITIEDEKTPGIVNIQIYIKEGQPLIIKSIRVQSDVKNHIKVSVGDIFDRDKLDKEIKRLRRYYKKQNYIKPLIGPYKFRNGELSIPVNLGQRIEISFKKNTVFNAKKLMKEIPFMDEEEITDESIEDTVNKIKKLYLSRGYYYAQVAAGVEIQDNLTKVTFFIFEGKKVTLKKINFIGISISPETIKGIIPLQEDEPFNEDILNSSKESIIRFYNALGYLQCKVTKIRKDFQKDGDELNLSFVVDEGPQVKIKAIKIAGNMAISTSEIRNVLQLGEGIPYNTIDIGDARYRVLSLYSRHGFIDARVNVKSLIDKDEAFLTFKITESKSYIIGKVIIRGNYKTKEKIIRREFTIKEGEPYNYEEILKIKQRLYNLGLFDEVSIDIVESVNSEESDEEMDGKLTKDVLVSLKEGKPGSVEIGLGYGDYEQFRGSLDISYRNLGGYNRQIGLRTEISSVEKRYIFNFREPWLFNKPNLPFKAFLIKEDRRSVNLDTKDVLYKIDRLSLIAGIERELMKRLKANLNYEYSFIDTKDVKPGVILSKEDTGTLAISSISPSLFYDTRDNPFDPTSGALNGIVLKFASSAFFSGTEFIKGTFQSSWFFQLRKGLVFAFSLKGGAAYSFDDAEELPLIERFFLGGRTTVRGYSHDTLGPKGADDTPTGGNIFAIINEELRISIGKGFGLVTFIDGGNVWRVAKDVEAALKYTAGAGLRYNTPVGPVRIDYGHKLKREAGESVGEVHFSFGHAF